MRVSICENLSHAHHDRRSRTYGCTQELSVILIATHARDRGFRAGSRHFTVSISKSIEKLSLNQIREGEWEISAYLSAQNYEASPTRCNIPATRQRRAAGYKSHCTCGIQAFEMLRWRVDVYSCRCLRRLSQRNWSTPNATIPGAYNGCGAWCNCRCGPQQSDCSIHGPRMRPQQRVL